ncbi:hypothetical protein Hanom_Chr05g00403661 [Helianthus anomalus]
MVQGFFSRGRIKVGARRRREVPMLAIACRSVLVRVLHQKAVTRLRWFSSITERRLDFKPDRLFVSSSSRIMPIAAGYSIPRKL